MVFVPSLICVYYLIRSDRPGEIRYVGHSADPMQRFADHCGHEASERVRRFVTETLASGATPALQIVGLFMDKAEAIRVEYELIRFHKQSGSADLNVLVCPTAEEEKIAQGPASGLVTPAAMRLAEGHTLNIRDAWVARKSA